MNAEVFRTFWHGPHLTWIAQLCLSSYIARGHRVELFSYAPVGGVPTGVIVRDAAEILPCKQLFLYRGGEAEISAPSLHSNLFRYKLLRDLGGWWIDADVLLLDGEIPTQVPVFGREDWVEDKRLGPSTEDKRRLGFGTAVMRFPVGAEIMTRAYAEAEAVVAANPAWGTTGPYLFTRLVEELGLDHHGLPQSEIYALTYKEAYKLARTEDREEVERRTNGAPFVHLFHHMLRLSGTSDELPPEGSFLGDQRRRFWRELGSTGMDGETATAFEKLRRKHLDSMRKLSDLELQRDELNFRADQVASELAEMSSGRDILASQLEQAMLRVRELEREGPWRLNAESRGIAADETAIRSFSFWMARRRILFGLARRLLAGKTGEVRSLMDQSLRAHGIPDILSAMVIDWLSTPQVILCLARGRMLAGMDIVQKLVECQIQQRYLERRFQALEVAKFADEKALQAAHLAIAKLGRRSGGSMR